MKKLFEYLGGFALIVFSFYFTDKVSLLVADKGELMQKIKAVSQDYYQKPVDAKVDEKQNTVVPGIYGKKINEKESYSSMKEFGIFNKNHLVYTHIKPKKVLIDNIDKYIISGNPLIRNVSLIIDENDDVISYLKDQKIKFDEIIKDKNEKNSGEIINGVDNPSEFDKVESNKKLCIYGYSNIDKCIERKYFIIKPQIILNSSNIITVKDQINPGALILIGNNATVEHVKVLLNEIKYKDIKVVYVSELIDEYK